MGYTIIRPATHEDWLLEREEEGGVTAEGVPFDYAIYKNLAMGF